MLRPQSSTVSRLTRPVLDFLECAADARKRGDHGAADAAELAAYSALRTLMADAGAEVRP